MPLLECRSLSRRFGGRFTRSVEFVLINPLLRLARKVIARLQMLQRVFLYARVVEKIIYVVL